jgi:heme/copper-type cytochrome/quinol oxidase subunit 4
MSQIIVTIFQCFPVQKAWDISLSNTPGSCIDLRTFYIGVALPNILTDIILTIVPVCIIMQLHMTPQRKLNVCLVFASGSM